MRAVPGRTDQAKSSARNGVAMTMPLGARAWGGGGGGGGPGAAGPSRLVSAHPAAANRIRAPKAVRRPERRPAVITNKAPTRRGAGSPRFGSRIWPSYGLPYYARPRLKFQEQ